MIKINDEYETPFEILRNASFDYRIYPKLDVCSTDENKKCYDYFTIKKNGLLQEWKQDFFMNPPYSNISEWMRKAFQEHIRNNLNGLILTFAKTDTAWWHNYVENKAEVHFIKGRLKFLYNGIKTKNSAPYPSCWIIYRKK
jgi:site-specific DNA-methyltransferase (adenine-specific)